MALHADEKPRLVRDLGDRSFLILRNHGQLTVGPTVADAFVQMYLLESACMIQVRAQGDGNLIRLGDTIVGRGENQWQTVTKGKGGLLAWPALLRKLDRVNPSYKT